MIEVPQKLVDAFYEDMNGRVTKSESVQLVILGEIAKELKGGRGDTIDDLHIMRIYDILETIVFIFRKGIEANMAERD